MVRLIGNVLVSGLAIILLSSCAAGVKVIDTYTIEKKREPLALADPKPLELQDIEQTNGKFAYRSTVHLTD